MDLDPTTIRILAAIGETESPGVVEDVVLQRENSVGDFQQIICDMAFDTEDYLQISNI